MSNSQETPGSALQAMGEAEHHSLRLGGLERPMPRDYTISLAAKGGTDHQLLSPGTQRRQPMRGFEEQYVDIIDYIVRITHRIWEEKNIGYIYDTYRHNARVTDDYGLQYGRDKIVADTIHMINAFAGIYGAPTGRQITMWGITQHRIVDGTIAEEWMLFNEFEVMQQIYRD